MDWWTLPVRLLRCYIKMLPRLEAETRLFLIRDSLVATPEYPAEARGKEYDRLIATAKGEQYEEPKVTRDQAKVMLASMGIKVVQG